MRILLLLALCIIATSCSSGSNDFGANADIQRLLLTSYTPGGDEIDLTVAGSTTGSFPAVSYFIFGSDTDMGSRTMVPLSIDRLNEQAFGPLAFGDVPLDIDLAPWEDYEAIYLRALVVTPSWAWKLTPGNIYEFSTN